MLKLQGAFNDSLSAPPFQQSLTGKNLYVVPERKVLVDGCSKPARYIGSLKAALRCDQRFDKHIFPKPAHDAAMCPVSRFVLKKLFYGLNGAVGACRYAYAVAIAFCRVYAGFTVHQGYRLLGAGFDAFKRTLAFSLINNYFHA
jgi:hypothetical protein